MNSTLQVRNNFTLWKYYSLFYILNDGMTKLTTTITIIHEKENTKSVCVYAPPKNDVLQQPKNGLYFDGHCAPIAFLVFQLLKPDSSNLPCLYSTFHLEYPLVFSRFSIIMSSLKLVRNNLNYRVLETSIAANFLSNDHSLCALLPRMNVLLDFIFIGSVDMPGACGKRKKKWKMKYSCP